MPGGVPWRPRCGLLQQEVTSISERSGAPAEFVFLWVRKVLRDKRGVESLSRTLPVSLLVQIVSQTDTKTIN